jgi:hypothetical protein
MTLSKTPGGFFSSNFLPAAFRKNKIQDKSGKYERYERVQADDFYKCIGGDAFQL